MTTESGQDHEQEQQQPEQELPDHPEGSPAETVDALEVRPSGAEADDGERTHGDDVSANPDTGGMEGLPGPPPGEPAEPAG